ncbi:hypothetical protein V6N11_017855 [Hibiscus sabdariffa]|uniref:DUF7870 domain-containing protein n=1 Tax=Hibiscus sabdariffa TaxID=183260 RepID=A0ABR2T6L4_9ROSI
MVKVLRSRVFKLLPRFLMVLAFTIVLNLWSGVKFIAHDESSLKPAVVSDDAVAAADPVNLEFLQFLFNDLKNERILKPGNKGVKGLLLSDEYDDETIQGSLFLTKIDIEFSSVNHFDKQSLIPDESLDFIFTKNFQSAPEFIDRSLKVGGIIAVQQLGEGSSSHSFNKPSNYNVVYYRKLQSANVFVMKKLENVGRPIWGTKRRLFGYNTQEEKKAALKKLEDVLLEPPASSGELKRHHKRTKYLPDLLKDTLDSYPRRVFINVSLPERDGGSGTNWFVKHYPTRNLNFEMYKIEVVSSKKKKKAVPEIGMSDWLRKNVKEEEYVVMKAEAEMVEEMVKSKAIGLVDELFLECSPKGVGGRKSMSKRAYWECLALYGKLRDEGVAVHQWWG